MYVCMYVCMFSLFYFYPACVDPAFFIVLMFSIKQLAVATDLESCSHPGCHILALLCHQRVVGTYKSTSI